MEVVIEAMTTPTPGWWWVRLNEPDPKTYKPHIIRDDDVVIPVKVWYGVPDDSLWMDVPCTMAVGRVEDFTGEFVCPVTHPSNVDKMITFRQRRDWGLKATAERCAALLYGMHSKVYPSPTHSGLSDEEADRYQVGQGNDAWLHKTVVPGVYKLNLRYGMTPQRKMWLVPAILDTFEATAVSADEMRRMEQVEIACPTTSPDANRPDEGSSPGPSSS